MKKNMKAPSALVQEAEQIMTGSYHTTLWPPNDEPVEILDVGACFGAYTVWACQMFPQARITAIEPNPAMVEMLEENLETFGFTDRVSILKTALGSRDGQVELVHGVNPGCTTTSPDGPMAKRVKDKTEMVSLLDAKKLCQVYDIIKVDTEGSEVGILYALAASSVLQSARLVAYEYHRRGDRVLLEELLGDDLGFTLVRGWITEPDTGTMIWAKEVPA